MAEIEQLAITQLGSRVVYADERIRVRVDDIAYPDGTRSTYTVVERRDFVTVIAVERGGFWLVEQYRYPVGQRSWEFVQGSWPPDRPGEPGESGESGESGTVLELAARELAEEAGLRAEHYEHLGRLMAGAGGTTQCFDVYLATGLTAGAPDREASEADMVHRWVPEDELRAMVRDRRITDALSLAALSLYDARPR